MIIQADGMGHRGQCRVQLSLNCAIIHRGGQGARAKFVAGQRFHGHMQHHFPVLSGGFFCIGSGIGRMR